MWVNERKDRKRKINVVVGGCAECDVLVWSLSAWRVASPLTPLCPIPWSPHTISVCRTSKDGSSPSCSPPSSSSPMWQLWREMTENQGLSIRSHQIYQSYNTVSLFLWNRQKIWETHSHAVHKIYILLPKWQLLALQLSFSLPFSCFTVMSHARLNIYVHLFTWRLRQVTSYQSGSELMFWLTEKMFLWEELGFRDGIQNQIGNQPK